jgi:hypothetical protein
MKRGIVIIALLAALSLAFFGSCGGENNEEPPAVEPPPEGFIEHELTITQKSIALGSEAASEKPVLEGESLELLKGATVLGSYLNVYYKSPVSYACGEIGGLGPGNGGPVIHGAKGDNKTQTVKVLVADIIQFIHEDGCFVFNMYNGGVLEEVFLYEAPEDYVYTPPECATADATKIVVPLGGNPPGKGDVSKADFKKIMDAPDAANLIIYTASEKSAGWGVLKFQVKYGASYSTTGVKIGGKEDLEIDADKKIVINIKTIKDAVAAVSGTIHGFDINAFDDAKEILYIEIVP